MVAYVPRGGDRAAIADTAMRRFGHSHPVVGTGPELLDHFARRAERGVERTYAWFCDFAPPETLAGFGEEVIARLPEQRRGAFNERLRAFLQVENAQ